MLLCSKKMKKALVEVKITSEACLYLMEKRIREKCVFCLYEYIYSYKMITLDYYYSIKIILEERHLKELQC